MKILFIDDDFQYRDPHGTLMRNIGGFPQDADVWWARTSREALDALKYDKEWDEVWLDHDLALIDGAEDTTMIVAQTLAELVFHGEINPAEFATMVIHTQNPVGRDNLELVLKRWGFRVRHVYL